MKEETTYHIPVLLMPSVDGMNIRPDGTYVDVTFGGAGHSREILSRLGEGGRLLGFDQDEDAERNIVNDPHFTFVRSNFRYLQNFLRYHDIEQVDAILADLGVMARMLTSKGLRATDLICSPDVADTIVNNEVIQKLLDNKRYELGMVEPEVLPAGAAVMARLNVNGRIISVISYDETYTDDAGKDQLYIPSGKCILTAPACGRTLYGAVTQVEQADGEFHTYAGRRVPKYLSNAEGNTRSLTISSRPLLIPNNKNPFIVADVLTQG